MTSLPLARVKSPVCDATILNFGSAEMTSVKPFLRSLAGAEPVVPCNSAMRTSPVVDANSLVSQSPALWPSAMKSEPRKLAYSEVSGESIARSVSTTGMLAAFASFSTVSHPDSTTGEKAMTLTFC